MSLSIVHGGAGTSDDEAAARRQAALDRRDTDTAEHDRVLRQVVEVHDEMRAVEQRLAQLQASRCAVLLVARNVDPPLSYRRIADAAGVTESAIVQVLRRVRG